jgi:hypothetical protein
MVLNGRLCEQELRERGGFNKIAVLRFCDRELANAHGINTRTSNEQNDFFAG